MINKLVKIGNSIGVTIPKKVLHLLNLEQGEEVLLETNLKENSIIIRPIRLDSQAVAHDVIQETGSFIKKYPKALGNLAK